MHIANIYNSLKLKNLESKKIISINDRKLNKLLQGASLNELTLDYIGTTFFCDLYGHYETLGAGGFGVVVKVLELATNEYYAMKVKIKRY